VGLPQAGIARCRTPSSRATRSLSGAWTPRLVAATMGGRPRTDRQSMDHGWHDIALSFGSRPWAHAYSNIVDQLFVLFTSKDPAAVYNRGANIGVVQGVGGYVLELVAGRGNDNSIGLTRTLCK